MTSRQIKLTIIIGLSVLCFFCILFSVRYAKKTKDHPEIVNFISHLNNIVSIPNTIVSFLILLVVFFLADIPSIFQSQSDWEFREKLFTESEAATLEGWRLHKTETSYDYSSYSEWQYTPIVETNSVKVKTETHYKWYTYSTTQDEPTSEIHYSETPVDQSPGIHCEPVTAYAYCWKTATTTYYYWKWSDWADCEEGEYQNDKNTEVRPKNE